MYGLGLGAGPYFEFWATLVCCLFVMGLLTICIDSYVVWGWGVRASVSVRDSRSRFGVWGLGFGVWGFRIRV